ncbi:MAG: TIGR02757 family protein [Crocinitomicaceae bacterium]|nr:TIGR02757 family protein [Crocinitomicaceae bacterium]
MNKAELQEYLDFKSKQYNTRDFIDSDPIKLPHRFTRKEDIEIVAFLVSTIAWGNRTMIIRSGERILNIMGNDPYNFVVNYESTEHLDFVHRTFNGIDLDFFFRSLKNIYATGGLEKAFSNHSQIDGVKGRIVNFRDQFLATEHEKRSEKHISNPIKNSACKRINMFLRWMVREDKNGVDFGIWKSISTSELHIPLDVHTSRNARELGLIDRKQDDWKALEELMINLQEFDSKDPSKYDFALFGIGAFEK